ncbi:MAG: hypothetical protein COV67_09960 [Nitrospinae bacterium CG11_big_fil_rev_8_21_14_0_20_56_8]|nr:MAG: hypothetical protein COV67_09960 [Nitrospinae bacterium CG11_big_fil_rev_8_21_14_0_20_56_8]
MKIDAEISLEEIDLKFYRSLQQFEPCGPENPVPVFLLRNVSVSGARTMGAGGGHVRFQARQGSRSVDVVGFNLAAELFTLLETQDALDLAGEVALNDWNGQRKVEMRLLDLRPAAKTAPQAG